MAKPAECQKHIVQSKRIGMRIALLEQVFEDQPCRYAHNDLCGGAGADAYGCANNTGMRVYNNDTKWQFVKILLQKM